MEICFQLWWAWHEHETRSLFSKLWLSKYVVAVTAREALLPAITFQPNAQESLPHLWKFATFLGPPGEAGILPFLDANPLKL